MIKMTITEALAEIKTIGKRLEKKREFVGSYLAREEKLRDPLEKDGGSVEAIRRERQAIRDLEERVVSLRRGIQLANLHNELTIGGSTRSIQDWLTWRREVAPGLQQFLHNLRRRVDQVHQVAAKNLRSTFSAAEVKTEIKEGDILVNINETELAQESEDLETTLGQLDGLLSLKNATLFVEI